MCRRCGHRDLYRKAELDTLSWSLPLFKERLLIGRFLATDCLFATCLPRKLRCSVSLQQRYFPSTARWRLSMNCLRDFPSLGKSLWQSFCFSSASLTWCRTSSFGRVCFPCLVRSSIVQLRGWHVQKTRTNPPTGCGRSGHAEIFRVDIFCCRITRALLIYRVAAVDV